MENLAIQKKLEHQRRRGKEKKKKRKRNKRRTNQVELRSTVFLITERVTKYLPIISVNSREGRAYSFLLGAVVRRKIRFLILRDYWELRDFIMVVP